MSDFLQLLMRVALAALGLLLAAGAIAWVLRVAEGARKDQREPERVCGRCGRTVRPGRWPAVITTCPPGTSECLRPR